MPFTFSHPAIVLPLARLSKNWLSLTGLIAGSVAPDFEYFSRMRMFSGISHKPEGLILFDLPAGLFLTFLFHNLIRKSLCDNSPAWIRSRVEIFEEFNWNRYFVNHSFAVIISILVGSMSHLFWDSFTHNYSFFVDRYEFLRWEAVIFGVRTTVHRVLQHLSTIAGGAVIVYFFWKLPVHKLGPSQASKSYWPSVIVLTIIISTIRLLMTKLPLQPALFVVTFIAAGIIAVSFTSVLLRLKRPGT